MYVCMNVCMFVRLFVCEFVCMYVHIYLHIYSYIYMDVCAYISDARQIVNLLNILFINTQSMEYLRLIEAFESHVSQKRHIIS